MDLTSSDTWIVDFDGTLINLDLGARFSTWVYSSRRVKRFSLTLRSLGAPFNFLLRRLDRGQLVRAWSWGLTQPELTTLIEDFLCYISSEIVLNELLLERIRKDQGANRILLTGCPQELVEAFLTKYVIEDFDAVIGMTVTCGVIITRHPYGRSTLKFVDQYASIVAIGDSWTDRFILRSASRAIVVPRVKRLEELALKLDWEILSQ
jgi:phosphoserine phosphatase